ncbi:MAG: metal-dependent hydrolase [Holosporales bacterium]|jgi:inner membrane protein|nr:metal-dependent hydrolase [Holosporales bacterium]
MDPITHALFGAVGARCLPFTKKDRSAWIIASISAVSPDLDLLIPCSGNSFVKASLHRYYTHALSFFPFEALILTVLFWYLYDKRLERIKVYTLALFGLCSHLCLDIMTSSGLPFLWPFTRCRFTFDTFPIVDFCFSAFLLVAFIGLWWNRRTLCVLGLALTIGYGAFAVVQHERAAFCQQTLCISRGHSAIRARVVPSPGSVLLWRSIYEYDGRYFVDGMRLGNTPIFYTGGNFPKASLEEFTQFRGTAFYKDCALFFWLMGGYVAVTAPGKLSGLCLSLLPHKNDMLPSICIDRKPSATSKEALQEPKIYFLKRGRSWSARLRRDGITFLKLLWTGEIDKAANAN